MNQENVQYENKEICAKCGGYCCKRGGCDYSINDFESLKIDYLQEKLDEGYISIVAYHDITRLNNGKIIIKPILFLRARNINRPIVDLISIRTKCIALTENGCLYDIDNRPSGGINFIPKENDKCYQLIPEIKFVYGWKKYQEILHCLVKRMTGKSVDENLKIDAENFFYDMFCKNFKEVMADEIISAINQYYNLIKIYPLEYQKAKKRYQSDFGLKLKLK